MSLDTKLQQAAMRAGTISVMIADNNGKIVYVNDQLKLFFAKHEPEIRKRLPGFSVRSLVGANFDSFHEKPSKQREMVKAMREPHEATLGFGGAMFDLFAKPLVDERGNRIGTMVEWRDASVRIAGEADRARLAAISRSQAMIEFTPAGEIVDCNDNFLAAVGYSKSEVVGKHHRIFCDAEYARSASYDAFWRKLVAGEYQSGEFERRARGGLEIFRSA